MTQTVVLPPHLSEVGGPFSVALDSSGRLIDSSGRLAIDSTMHSTIASRGRGPRQRVMERGEILGALACEIPFHAVIDPDLMTIQSSPVVVLWPFSGTGEGPQPFVALFPSGAVRGVSALLRGETVEFSRPMELIDPDLDPVPGMPFRFELFQFAPHPRDRGIPSLPASQTPAIKESEASVPAKTKTKLSQPLRTVKYGTPRFQQKLKTKRIRIMMRMRRLQRQRSQRSPFRLNK